jgi:hypothetical protein
MSPNNPVIEKTTISPFPGLLWLRPDHSRQATAVADPENSRRTCTGVRKP